MMQIQVQIDGFRVLAQRTGQYGGSDRALFDEGLSLYEHLQTKRGKPQTCSMTVYRIVSGQRCPFTAEITWDDFYPGQKNGFMWDSKPYQMLSKAAESQALRKAFQLELSNLETPEESIAIEPSRIQMQRSDAWMEMQRRFLNCSNTQEMEQLIQETRDRVPVGEYELDRVVSTTRDRIAAQQAIEVSARTVQEQTAEQIKIKFFRACTKIELEKIQAIVDRTNLPKSSSEFNSDQAFILISEMLIEWAVSTHWLDRHIVTLLLSKSIERTSTDEDLWNDFTLSIESYIEDNKS